MMLSWRIVTGSWPQSRLDALGRSFVAACVVRNVAKDEDLTEHTEALGVHIGNDPPLVEPALSKLVPLALAMLHILRTSEASPKAFHTVLGVAQWFAQVARWLYGCFDAVYDVVKREPEHTAAIVPDECLNELATFSGALAFGGLQS